MKIKHYLLFIVLLFNIGITRVAIASLPPYCVLLQSDIPEEECDALVDLYIYMNGSGWTDSSGWMSLTDPCTTWYGVECEANRVSSLDLWSNNLSGSIPSSIGNLTNLYSLNLAFNQLSGSIPSSIRNSTNLGILFLHQNQLSGSIPPEIGDMTSLSTLSLSYNQLSGSIPPEIGDLTSLSTLFLSYNQLSGSIPHEIGSLINLNGLFLNDNQLCGKIPTSLTNLINLGGGCGGSIDINNNYLYTNDSALDAFIILKGGDWESSQGARCPADSEKTILYQIIMGASRD